MTGRTCGILAVLVIGAAAGLVWAEPTSENNEQLARALKRFPQADLNGDGVLTASEAREAVKEFRAQQGEKAKRSQGAKVKPTEADVKYGPHERNVLDFWKAESDKPTPLVVFIHGGGFVGGDKSKASGAAVQRCLDAGVSFMSINYRFRKHAPIQDILRDAARAIQFVRHNAKKYNIDSKRVASFGGSAGAGTSLWLAVHADLADPDNADPVLRQSSRLVAAGCLSGQATYNLLEWDTLIGPFKKEWMRSPNEKVEFYHFEDESEFETPEGRKILADCSMIGLITPDDPPIYMLCPLPNTEPTNRGHYVHHPRHVLAVKKRCKEKKVECVTVLQEDLKGGAKTPDVVDFFFKHLRVR